ncbi:MAG: aldehyde dehydrogenase family protein [Candidatus Oxydemutatoraceae bacterium WSBS_2016_MAG_OTU14]
MMQKKSWHTLVPGKNKISGNLHEITSPWSGEVIGAVEVTSEEEAMGALQTASRIYKEQRFLPKAQRIEILAQAKEIVIDRAEELAVQAASEGGKPLVDSRVELARAIDGVQSCIDCLRTEHGEEIPMGISASSANRIAMTTHEPIGVVLAYSAFNHPFNLIVHQVGPAIASGCPVIVKPAMDTPLSCYSFVDILHEAGLPKEYCQAIHFDNIEMPEKMVESKEIGFFSFIGSAKVGWMIRSKLAPGVRCALEHGGAAPVIVSHDANLEECLPLIAKGGFYHAGQVCVSVQRVFVHESIADSFVKQLATLAEASKIGDPTSDQTEVGPLIRSVEVDRVESWVNEAVAEGAKLVCGGKRLDNNAYACTVLLNPDNASKVSQAEIFGPVICVYTYNDIDNAIERANQLPFSFQAAVVSRDIDTAMYCFRRLNAAAVFVNDHTAFRVDWMPFAGHRVSGHGTGGMRYSFEEMQARKLLVIRSKGL